jgi:hypothetical protein
MHCMQYSAVGLCKLAPTERCADLGANYKMAEGQTLFKKQKTFIEVLPGSLARQSGPAVWPGSLARQSGPAVWPGSLARQCSVDMTG